MKLTNCLKKAFLTGDWYVGYRSKNEEKYKVISLPEGTWIADPFLIAYNGKHYLFTEYVEDTKGKIAYFRFENDKPVFQRVVIDEPYHLSYPCVFEKNNQIFMIPESADNCSIDLYRAISFPEQWEKVAQMAKGMYFDSTYYCTDGKDYLFTYRQRNGRYELILFEMNFADFTMKQIDCKLYKTNVGRPGGMCKNDENKIVRVAQDCSAVYGKNLIYYQGFIQDGHYSEERLKTVSVEDIDSRFQRVHTYNEDDCYETVDFFKERISLKRPFVLTLRKIRMRIREAVDR